MKRSAMLLGSLLRYRPPHPLDQGPLELQSSLGNVGTRNEEAALARAHLTTSADHLQYAMQCKMCRGREEQLFIIYLVESVMANPSGSLWTKSLIPALLNSKHSDSSLSQLEGELILIHNTTRITNEMEQSQDPHKCDTLSRTPGWLNLTGVPMVYEGPL
ncbi:hypothetical protein NDU88_005983 [Pleurodeles waltl]|uniref:Uncharacterized protein n=1 Tax=Pleurodeles waltl TaxID=8319 RepID=A0AAV7QJV4_PLEWA|nr:hypothetical protein NDU88_005983 [Pleurodeles waltl]